MTTQPSQITLPRIGTLWPEQGGIFIGVCPSQNGQPDYALIAPANPRALLENVQWGPYGVEIADADSDWDGKSNTTAMADAASELAGAILDLEIDGHHDFYLPARHELRMIKLVAPTLIEKDWHWTSTQYSATITYVQYFADGYQSNCCKDSKYRARVVRRFLINSSI